MCAGRRGSPRVAGTFCVHCDVVCRLVICSQGVEFAGVGDGAAIVVCTKSVEFASRHVTSRHVTSRHLTSRHVTSRHVMSCHVTSCRVVSRRVASRRVLSSVVTCHWLASCRVASSYTPLRFVRLTSHRAHSHLDSYARAVFVGLPTSLVELHMWAYPVLLLEYVRITIAYNDDTTI